jgi:hypothetical protein
MTHYETVIAQVPDDPVSHDQLARLLALCPVESFRDSARAVSLARRALELAPDFDGHRRTLGIAYGRLGNWMEAVRRLKEIENPRTRGDVLENLFLAMALWQTGDKQGARRLLDQNDRWIDNHRPHDVELRRIRAEAANITGHEQLDETGNGSAESATQDRRVSPRKGNQREE